MSDSSEHNAGGPLRHDEVTRLGEHLAGLSASGLPLGPGLRAAAAEMPRGRLRSAFLALAESFDQGASVEEAIELQRGRLPEHLRALVAAGSKSGEVSQVLGQYVGFMNAGQEIRRGLWVSLAYPVMALMMALFIMSLVAWLVVGAFATIFQDFGIPLPAITIVLLKIASVFEAGFFPLLTFMGLAAGLWLLGRLTLRASLRRSLFGGIPVIGLVARNTSLAEFCHLLSLLLESRLPMPEAVRLTGEGVGDVGIDRACRYLRRDVEGGLSLSAAVARQPLFPRGLPRLIHWAEQNQSLAKALSMVGEIYAARARSQARFAGTLLTVLAVTTILLGVVCVAVGFVLPMVTLISKFSG